MGDGTDARTAVLVDFTDIASCGNLDTTAKTFARSPFDTPSQSQAIWYTVYYSTDHNHSKMVKLAVVADAGKLYLKRLEGRYTTTPGGNMISGKDHASLVADLKTQWNAPGKASVGTSCYNPIGIKYELSA